MKADNHLFRHISEHMRFTNITDEIGDITIYYMDISNNEENLGATS
jgi:hypothetical protein